MSNPARRRSSPSIASGHGRQIRSELKNSSCDRERAFGGSEVLATILLIIHGLVAVALLGAITHQTLAAWASADARPGSFFGRFRSVPSASFANAVVILYAASTLLGGIVYLYFRVDVRPELERAGHWHLLGFFDLKEHFAAIGLALLPAYLVCWRRPRTDEPAQTRTALTSVLAFVVWWNFLTGHVANNIMGFGS
jgi:hypothetical protein